MTTLTDSLQTKVVNYTTLKALNATAIRLNYNRSFVWETLDKVISKEHYFPLKQWMLHEYGAEAAARCQVFLNYEGATGWLDVPLSIYNKLVDAEAMEAKLESEVVDD